MSVHSKPFPTPAEYLALERAAETRSEYLGGEMVAMTGTSRNHNRIAINLGAALHQQLREGPCEVYLNDMRVWVPATGLYTYPDVLVVGGEVALVDEYDDMLTNPMALIAVLSPSTESYDRGRKFEHYRALDSLREYVLVSQDEPRIEQYVRQGDGKTWLFSEQTGVTATLTLPSIKCEVLFTEVYRRVRFPEKLSPS